jgi:hypothetical protein
LAGSIHNHLSITTYRKEINNGFHLYQLWATTGTKNTTSAGSFGSEDRPSPSDGEDKEGEGIVFAVRREHRNRRRASILRTVPHIIHADCCWIGDHLFERQKGVSLMGVQKLDSNKRRVDRPSPMGGIVWTGSITVDPKTQMLVCLYDAEGKVIKGKKIEIENK